jgi:hypothetical protein
VTLLAKGSTAKLPLSAVVKGLPINTTITARSERERREIGGAGYSQLLEANSQRCIEMALTICIPKLSTHPASADGLYTCQPAAATALIDFPVAAQQDSFML